MMKERTLWILFVFLVILGGLWKGGQLPDAQLRLASLPLEGEGYSGRNLPLSPFEKNFFSSITLLKRLYQIQGRFFYVFVLDGTHNRHVIHDPFYCFRGWGWIVDQEEEISFPSGKKMRLVISKNGEKREALFWFSEGRESFASSWQYWLKTTLRRVSLGALEAEPVLVIMQSLDNNPVDWKEILNEFSPILKL